MKIDNRIIVDFDDTLCIHKTEDTSDIMSGTPNKDLINKINELYDKGHTISIFTARGHFSCPTREDAIAKHRPTIQKWLKKHNVKYTELSFNKPYGIIYIDDKAIRPNELNLLDKMTKDF